MDCQVKHTLCVGGGSQAPPPVEATCAEKIGNILIGISTATSSTEFSSASPTGRDAINQMDGGEAPNALTDFQPPMASASVRGCWC